jgi:diguanylate cyclase (GGDEF)-like protein
MAATTHGVPASLIPPSPGDTTHRLAELVGSLSGHDDAESTVRAALERAAEASGSAAGAIVSAAGDVIAAIGWGPDAPPRSRLRAVAAGRRDEVQVPELGDCEAIAVPIEAEGLGHLVLARPGERFSREESNLLRAAARVITLNLQQIDSIEADRLRRSETEQRRQENERLLSDLRERQKLFERLSRIQSSIVSRLAIDDVLHAIVEGAAELLGDQTVALRLIDRSDPTRMIIVASHGIPGDVLERNREGTVGEGAGGRAIAEERLVVIESYARDPHKIDEWATYGVKSAMGAPVRENGKVVGSLVVARESENRAYTVAEREILVAFAKHASLALSDARTVHDAVHQALHDPLTGLPNRTLLLDRLGQAQVRAESAGSQVAVLFCDLDSFKTVNDSLGHVAGDELLIAVGARLLGCVRPGDTAARFGGDEFAVLIEDIDGVDVHKLAERILAALEEPFMVRGKEVFLSGSIGIAMGGGSDADLLRDADLAMYRAKRGGSGRHETFAPHMHASVVERLELEAELKRAILADQLGTHYQPILELPTGRLAGVEALVRWEHPTRGMMSPGEFIPIAEETGAIIGLGRAVLFDACGTVAAWQRTHPSPKPMSVSVNVSVLQLDQDGFIEDVREALRESGLAPGSLTLELTETAFSRDPEVMAATLGELNELDVELAIDDFGTGFSSLQHLQHFPINMLKIPKPFIDDVGGPADDSSLTRAIIDIGGSLNLRVVAEGIERQEQLDRLLDLDCRFGQGYLLGRPMTADAIEALLEPAPAPAGLVAPAITA